MNYFNKALETFSTNVVNPIYYVFFSTSTIFASLILFQGMGTTGAADSVSLICGFLVIFMGVYLLNLSREPDAPHHRGGLEAGLMSESYSITCSRSGRLTTVLACLDSFQTLVNPLEVVIRATKTTNPSLSSPQPPVDGPLFSDSSLIRS